MQLAAAYGASPHFKESSPLLRCVLTPQLRFADMRLQKSAVYDVCNYQHDQLHSW